MSRLTGRKRDCECYIGENCPAEDWMLEVTGTPFSNWNPKTFICKDCPFMIYINKLAEYEDKEERMEDDLK